jgi:DNA repair protein RecN (Recombination protein N)
LTIKNYALIQRLEMKPSANLNIITGETGAGKSIMIGAVGLLLGNRADIKTLYDESSKCIIEGVFNIQEYDLSHFYDVNDLDYQENTIIRREISPTGKSRAFVNDTPVNLEILRELGSFLMDVHSQHDTLQLASNDYQLSIIDAFAGNQVLLQEYKESYKAYKKAEKAFQHSLKESEEINKEADYNHFLLEELSKTNLTDGEQEEIEEELRVLEHSEEIKLKLNQALGWLNHSEISVSSGLYETNNAIGYLKEYSEKFRLLGDRVESCLIEIKDIINEIEREEIQIEHDPEKIEAAKERLSLIYQLQQKHRVSTIGKLLAIQRELEEKVGRSLNLDEEIVRLKEVKDKLWTLLLEKAEQLSGSRRCSFDKFSAEIESLLRGLGMPNATLRIDRGDEAPTITGIDSIRMLFSANKGIPPQELKTVASGGEFSRLMFCVKYMLADKTALPTIVFDEVDAGISGEIANKMVNMMEQMAKKHQALVITHLPQIAAKGDQHYYVYKDDSADKTVSNIKLLDEGERLVEIAKMLSGEKPSPAALENARELLGRRPGGG